MQDNRMNLLSGKYNIIYADPPWSFRNKKTGGSMKSGAASLYSVMNVQDICNLPIQDIAAEDTILFMWWVGSQPREAIDVVDSWGFELKTMTGFQWIKKTVHWKPFFGMGFWTRCVKYDTEIYIYDVDAELVRNVQIDYLVNKDITKYLIWANTGWKKIKNFINSGIRDTYAVTTRAGVLNTSLNHTHVYREPVSRRDGKKRIPSRVIKESTTGDMMKAMKKSMVVDHGYTIDLMLSNTSVLSKSPLSEYNGISLDKEMGWLIGLYLAEGSRHGNKKREIRLSLNSKEVRFYERLKLKVDSFGLFNERFINTPVKVRWNTYGSRGNLSFASGTITDFIGHFIEWGTCYTKRLKSDLLLNTPVEFRQGILDGILDGDGCIQDRNTKLALSNELLICDVMNLCKSLGIRAVNYGAQPSTYFGSSEHSGKYHHLMTCNLPKREIDENIDAEAVSIRDISCIGKHQLYDIEVEDSLFVANGLITHNSGGENCLIATRGKPRRISGSVRSVVEARAEKHSKKPHVFRERIVELMGDLPRIELFAREESEGWQSWGNEL